MKKKMLSNFFVQLKINPKNESLYHTALVHRSFVNETDGKIENNERLEFLGDAVLELATTEYLFETFPDRSEGTLTSFRSALVRTESLAQEATRLGIGKYIYMSKGEEASGGRNRPYILANTLEAIIGAIYLDLGYKSCKKFITENICYKVKEIAEKRLDIDAKSRLQEISQDVTKLTPSYELVNAKGPDHNKTFEMAVKIGKFIFTTGVGKSKQEAEQNAAQKAIENWDTLLKKYFKNQE
jgi:ribonuclease-3